MSWKNFFRFSYALFFVFCAALLYFGRDYYAAPSFQKARHALNPAAPSGWPAPFGIIGMFFMLLLLLYSVRKRCVSPDNGET